MERPNKSGLPFAPHHKSGVYNDPCEPGGDRRTAFETAEMAGGGKKRILHGVFRVVLILQNAVRNSDQSLARNRKHFLKQLVLLGLGPSSFSFEVMSGRLVSRDSLSHSRKV
jgi:hypothetical protein